ncbi:MAG: cytochrome P450, partial [Synechocystis sp.]|nr:cytochrome P450 [Synechocystis sp.]
MSVLPGSNASPLRQLLQWLKDPLDYMDSNAKAFGLIFESYASGKKAVMVGSSQAVQTLLASPEFTAPGDLNEIARPLLGSNSLILLNEPAHQQRRKLVMPPFHGDRLGSYGETMREITQQTINSWGLGQPFDVRESMQDITLRVILKTVFGIQDGDRLETLKQGLVKRFEMTAKGLGSTFIFLPFLRQDWGAWSPWGRIMAQQRYCDDLIYAEIGDRRANPDPNRIDILNLLLTATDEKGEHLSDKELRDELMTLLFAGHETTATALTWALYLIHQQPKVYQTLMEELGTLGTNPDPMTVGKLPYLTAVCNETLRLYPVGMLAFARQAKTATTIGDYTIEAGTPVIASIYLAHRDPDIYPDPEQFRPERFLDRQFSAFEFIPFGFGSRRCIGSAFAQMEMKLVLATILTQVKLQH